MESKVQPLIVRIFLASPGDVNDERKIVYQEINDFVYNNPFSKGKVHLEPVGWDRYGKYVPMEANQTPQQAIDTRLPRSSDCDIVFIIFKSRMGRPMPPEYIKPPSFQYKVNKGEEREWYFSGTEWEFVNAMQEADRNGGKYPHVFVLRCSHALVPYDLDDATRKEYDIQRKRISNFFMQFEKGKEKYLTKSYDTYQDLVIFREKVRTQLTTIVSELLESPPQQLLQRKKVGGIKREISWSGSPYPGLTSFEPEQNGVYFGRQHEVDELIKKVEENQFVAVIGASGAGKSSIVRAGLLPALANDAILIPKSHDVEWDDERPEWAVKSSNWLHLIMTPGAIDSGGKRNPFNAFCDAIIRTIPHKCSDENQQLFFKQIVETATELVRSDIPQNTTDCGRNIQYEQVSELYKIQIREAICHFLTPNVETSILLVLIDQFEELFTIVERDTCRAFVKFIEHLVCCERVKIVVTMRADFYNQCIQYHELADLLKKGNYPLSRPDLSALNEMIRRPAEVVGMSFEKNLAERILVQTSENVGALPLLAYLLEQMYELCRVSKTFTSSAFSRLGGVTGAISKEAEKVIEKLERDYNFGSAKIKEKFNLLFRELVEIGTDGTATRKRAIKARVVNDEVVELLFRKLTNARLLVTNGGINEKKQVDDEVIEIAHEALLKEWHRLQKWIEEKHEDHLFIQKTESAVKEWLLFNKQKKYLWEQDRLDMAYKAYKSLGYFLDQLNQDIQDFLEPEFHRLVRELQSPECSHNRRNEIGLRFDKLGDSRYGLEINTNGIPQIAWCENQIPGGKVKIEGYGNEFEVKPFYIAKYPVTLKQFKAFIKAKDGYFNLKWWEGLGKTPDNQKPRDQVPDIDNHPACWVSWYQGVAFSRWLSYKLGYAVRVPYEWEWQQAATGGDPSYIFPWGSEWLPEKCNSMVSGINAIVSVGLYPDGKSPIGAEDMAGNIYEWCMNHYDIENKNNSIEDDLARTTRGGAYFVARPLQDKLTSQDAVKTTTRLADDPSAPAKGNIRVALRLVADIIPQ